MENKIKLEDGMVIKTRGEDKGLIIGDKIIFNDDSVKLSEYERDFYHLSEPSLDIVEVYNNILDFNYCLDFEGLDVELVAKVGFNPKHDKLESRMMVRLRSGDVCLVIDDVLLGNGFMIWLKDYKHDLTFKGVEDYGVDKNDIVEVYSKISSLNDVNEDSLKGLELLWSRKEN